VDKAKADDQRHAGERQHHHLKVRKAVVGKQRKIVHDMPPKDVPVISRSEPAEGSWWRPCIFEQTLPLGIDEPPAVLDGFAIGVSLSARDGDAWGGQGLMIRRGRRGPDARRHASHGHGCRGTGRGANRRRPAIFIDDKMGSH